MTTKEEIIYTETMLYIENNEYFYKKLQAYYEKAYEFYKNNEMLLSKKIMLKRNLRKLINEAIDTYKIEIGFDDDYRPKAKDKEQLANTLAEKDFKDWCDEKEKSK